MNLYLASHLQNEAHNIVPIWELFKDVVNCWCVVDSGSNDGTQNILRDVVGEKLILIESDMIKSQGYGYSRSKIIELCQGADFCLIIDGDERMLPEDIEKLHPTIESHNDCDLIILPRCHYHDWEMTQVEYGNMETIGNDWREAIRINPDWQPRLIKRTIINGRSKVQFYRRVHEMVTGIENDYQSLDNPVIRHFGWLKSSQRKLEISSLCDKLWEMDKENKAVADTYILENEAGTAMVSSPWNTNISEDFVANMCEVEQGLWIGNSGDAVNIELILKNNITAAINVATDLEIEEDDILRKKVGLIDGPGNSVGVLLSAVKEVLDLWKDGNVLIHGHDGKSRSVVVAALAIVIKKELLYISDFDIYINRISNARKSRPDENLVNLGREAMLEHVRNG